MNTNNYTSNVLTQLIDYQKEILKSLENNDKILQILKLMEKIKPCLKDLKKSEIGKTLKKLTNSKCKEVKDMSNILIKKWKNETKNEKNKEKQNKQNLNDNKNKKEENENESKENEGESIEKTEIIKKEETESSKNKPKSPNKDEINEVLNEIIDNSLNKQRNNIRKIMLTKLLNNLPLTFTPKNAKDKVIEIENKLYEIFPNDSKYLNRGKTLISNISDPKNNEFRIKILSGFIPAEKLITMNVADMATKEMKAERSQTEEKIFESLRSDWNDKHAPVFEGMHKCFKCGGKRTRSFEFQMRSSDEPMTIFITCIDCGNEWRIG